MRSVSIRRDIRVKSSLGRVVAGAKRQTGAIAREIVYDPPLALRTACAGAEGRKSRPWMVMQHYVICLYPLWDISIITNSCFKA